MLMDNRILQNLTLKELAQLLPVCYSGVPSRVFQKARLMGSIPCQIPIPMGKEVNFRVFRTVNYQVTLTEEVLP